MIQTQKRYKKVKEGLYVEDQNGFNIGFQWMDNFQMLRRVIYTMCLDDLDHQFTVSEARCELYDPSVSAWILTKTDSSRATMDSYVDAGGTLQAEPFEADGVTLKTGLIPEFEFFFNIQLQIFQGVMKSIQVRKFGATDFN